MLALDEEFDKLRHDAAERATEAGRGAVLIGTAGAFGLIAVGALGSLPVMALRRVMPARSIALTVAVGSGVAAAVLGRMGRARIAAIAPQALEQEVKEAVEDVSDAV